MSDVPLPPLPSPLERVRGREVVELPDEVEVEHHLPLLDPEEPRERSIVCEEVYKE